MIKTDGAGHSARKAKRTKRELLLQVESMNTDTIRIMLKNFGDHLEEDMKLKKDFMILRTVLLQKGVVSEAELMSTERALTELQEMQEKGLLIGGKE
jgi:hypothetical protein